jgi:hypothetical protein
LAFRGEPEGDDNSGGAQGDGDPPQLVEAAGISGDLCLAEDHDQDRRAEDAAELAAADRAGFALLVDETGVGERAAVTNVEPNMAGFDPIDDVRELNRSLRTLKKITVASRSGNSPPGEVADTSTPPGLVMSSRASVSSREPATRLTTTSTGFSLLRRSSSRCSRRCGLHRGRAPCLCCVDSRWR